VPDLDAFLSWTLRVAALEAVAAFLFVTLVRLTNRRHTGSERVQHRAPRLGSRLLLVPLALLLFLVLRVEPPETPSLLALLVASGACLWIQPRRADEARGSAGVQVGWRARRYEQLEEWRLTGDHLRFRLGGAWVAVGVPREAQAELRDRLESACPEQESAFRS